MDLSIFKAYDVRGVVPTQLNEDMAYLIGRAFSALSGAKTVAVGKDVRASSTGLLDALCKGLTDGGTDVQDLGLVGTEEVNVAAAMQQLDGGIMVTASHNPMEYNGMKILGKSANTLETPYTLEDMKNWIATHAANLPAPAAQAGTRTAVNGRESYLERLLGLVDTQAFTPVKIVMNAGNGCAGPVADALEAALPMATCIKLNIEPDGTFPNGIPNPLLPENRAVTSKAVVENGADFGIAWDGDFDRCFMFDENGTFISPYQLGSVLAKAYLKRAPGSTVLHDPRLEWNTRQTIESNGGKALRVRCGYTFFKKAQRESEGVFGTEASGHFFFKDFGYCDSGMLTWLVVWEMLSQTGKKLSELVAESNAYAWACDETNRKLSRPAAEVLAGVEKIYASQSEEQLDIDGLSMSFSDWRFNLRASNTEPLVRLNVEARTEQQAKAKQAELLAKIDEISAASAA